jgi:very-short-patch-repair endonuclease
MHAQPRIDLHGVVARRDLLAAGVGTGAIAHRLAVGRLFVKYRGVYAVGRPDVSVWGERRAIVLACGTGAVLAHRSAAGAWGLRPSAGAVWDVAIPSARRPAAPVRVHRRRLSPGEVTHLEGIPITTVARTHFDLASAIPVHHLRRAVERSVELDRFDLAEVRGVLDGQRGRPGAPQLAALLEDFRAHGVTRTRSDAEAAFLQLCLDHGLPRPRVNRHADGREADFTWDGHPLIVEVDGYRHHRSRRAFGVDRAKDRAALRAGRPTARFTADEIGRDAAGVAAELRALLAR